jgi:hypothetical protein
VSNRFCDLSQQSALYTEDPEAVLDLEVGQEYLVYAISTDTQDVAYYTCGSHYSYYPRWYPASLFEVIDGRPSRYWVCSTQVDAKARGAHLLLTFPEWATRAGTFYWNLTEKDTGAVQAWEKYKQLIEEEFPLHGQ